MTAIQLIIVPEPDDPECAEVLVDGLIDDRPYRFLLDTGAATSRVVWDDYTSTLPSVDGARSSGLFAPRTRDSVTVANLEVGPIRAANLSVDRSPRDVAEGRSLIGMDVLRSYCLGFEFDEGRVLILDRFPDSSHSEDLLVGDRGHPYIPVRCGAQTAMAVWDTGASMTVVDDTFLRRAPASFRAAGSSIGTDSTGTAVETKTFVMAESEIGRVTFPPHRVAAVDLSALNATIEIPMDMILGYTTLRLARWVFDFPHRKWAVTRLATLPAR